MHQHDSLCIRFEEDVALKRDLVWVLLKLEILSLEGTSTGRASECGSSEMNVASY